ALRAAASGNSRPPAEADRVRHDRLCTAADELLPATLADAPPAVVRLEDHGLVRRREGALDRAELAGRGGVVLELDAMCLHAGTRPPQSLVQVRIRPGAAVVRVERFERVAPPSPRRAA